MKYMNVCELFGKYWFDPSLNNGEKKLCALKVENCVIVIVILCLFLMYKEINMSKVGNWWFANGHVTILR